MLYVYYLLCIPLYILETYLDKFRYYLKWIKRKKLPMEGHIQLQKMT